MTTQNFRDVAESAMSEEPLEPVNTSEVTEPEQPAQAPEPETTEEIKPFAEKGDLKGRTPEEYEEIYSNWNKSYTQKRQQETKELKELREKVALYEQSQQPTESEAPQTQQIQSPEGQDAYAQVLAAFKEGRIDEAQLAGYIKAIQAEEVRNLVEETVTQQAQIQQEQQYQEKAVEAFYQADERLNENSPNFQPRMQKAIGSEMANLLDAYMQENGTSIGFDYAGETQRLIQEYDTEIDAIVRSRVQKSTQMAQVRAAKAAKTQVSGNSAPVTDGKPKGLRDVIEASL